MSKTSETFSRYDSADYLTGIEDVAAYLEAALDEAGDDPAVVAQALANALGLKLHFESVA